MLNAFCILSDVETFDALRQPNVFLLLQLIGEMFDADTSIKHKDLGNVKWLEVGRYIFEKLKVYY